MTKFLRIYIYIYINISYKTARVVRLTPLLKSQGTGNFISRKKMVRYTFQKILSRFDFFWRNLRLWLNLEVTPFVQSIYPFSCYISTYRSTTMPKDLVIAFNWFGCSDSPKLPISCKNAIFAICGHFWAWPLWATFWISIFKLSYDTFPMIEFMYPAP